MAFDISTNKIMRARAKGMSFIAKPDVSYEDLKLAGKYGDVRIYTRKDNLVWNGQEYYVSMSDPYSGKKLRRYIPITEEQRQAFVNELNSKKMEYRVTGYKVSSTMRKVLRHTGEVYTNRVAIFNQAAGILKGAMKNPIENYDAAWMQELYKALSNGDLEKCRVMVKEFYDNRTNTELNDFFEYKDHEYGDITIYI